MTNLLININLETHKDFKWGSLDFIILQLCTRKKINERRILEDLNISDGYYRWVKHKLRTSWYIDKYNFPTQKGKRLLVKSDWNYTKLFKWDTEKVRTVFDYLEVKYKDIFRETIILKTVDDIARLNVDVIDYLKKYNLVPNSRRGCKKLNEFKTKLGTQSYKKLWKKLTDIYNEIRTNQALKSKSNQIKDVIIERRLSYLNKPWYKQYQDLWNKLEQQIKEIVKQKKVNLIAKVIQGYFKKILELKNSYWTNYSPSSERWLCWVVSLDYIEKYFNN